MAENDWAIVIGINAYKFLPSDDHLKYAVNDALKMRQFLCEQAKFPEENVLLCCDISLGVTSKWTPDKPDIRHLLQTEIKRAKGANNFWFFYAGHGIVHEHQDFLLPHDGNPDDLEATAIPISFVTNCLRDCGAENVVLVMDMCRNRSRSTDEGSRDIGQVMGEQTRKIAKEQGIVTLFSCSRGQRSYEIGDLEQGAFTYALLEGLRQSTTPRALEQYLTDRLPALNRQYGKRIQEPMIIPEPGWKYDRPLLLSCATPADIQQLAVEAMNTDLEEQDYEKAKTLWWQVIEADRSTQSDRAKARKAIDRINHTIYQKIEADEQQRAEEERQKAAERQLELERQQALEQQRQAQLKQETTAKQRQAEEQERQRRADEELKRQQAEAERLRQEALERQRVLDQQRREEVQRKSTVQPPKAPSERSTPTTPIASNSPIRTASASVPESPSPSPTNRPNQPPASVVLARRQFLKWAIPAGVGAVGVTVASQFLGHQSPQSSTSSPPSPSATTSSPPSPSAITVDYSKLEGFMKAGQWQEADQETITLMLKVANREMERYLDSNSIENFPCEVLSKIDRLWVEYSNGRFGFSVQKKIWNEMGSPTSFGKDWDRFCVKVGWKNAENNYVKPKFDLEKSPNGELPSRGWLVIGVVGVLGGFMLFSRAATCRL